MISRRTGLAATAAALLTGASGPAAAAAAPHRRLPGPRGRLQSDVDAILATGATGVLAEVQSARGRTTARAGAAGLRTPDRPVPWDASYRIGSDTKTFTATLALQLVGERRLALTDTVERWLPGAVRGNGNDGRRITVADLLRQTSGLNDYLAVSPDTADAFTPDGYRRSRFRTTAPEDQLKAALSRPPQWLPDPGQPAGERRWGYSNTNYVVAGLIIEEVTGNPWAQEIHDRIIEPWACATRSHREPRRTCPTPRPPRTPGSPTAPNRRTRRWPPAAGRKAPSSAPPTTTGSSCAP